ncbi:hypothetical protein [uncultured Psychrosphaera sp.]|jgi:hypothetical protein|uniref:hypothetical protein n=1 Tax=uncultured Psychrosphaera sp. TaxID=1403522 RepID=UPI002613E8AC|nr:hypothetical protein [uncultured Psychrosphaera sp.]
MKPLVILTLLLLSFTSTAEEVDQTYVNTPQGWSMNVNLGLASINSDLNSQGLGDSASVFGLSFDQLNENKYLSIFAERVSFEDDYSFSQDVVITSGYGGSSNGTEKSEASALSIGGAYGFAWFVNENKSMLYAQGGVNLLLDATRGIPNCSDCYEEDLDVSGGLFGRVGANIFIDNIILGVYSSLALSGDVESNFGIKLGFQFD